MPVPQFVDMIENKMRLSSVSPILWLSVCDVYSFEKFLCDSVWMYYDYEVQ